MLDLGNLDLEEIANALADQTDYEHRWLINLQTGEIAFWTAHFSCLNDQAAAVASQNPRLDQPHGDQTVAGVRF